MATVTHRMEQLRQKPYVAAVAITLAVLLFLGWKQRGLTSNRTLVIYVFSATEEQYPNNLRFFLKEGIRPNDGADYFIILQDGKPEDIEKLPVLPANARYVLHENRCYDLGTVGWMINQSGLVQLKRYKYIIWLNSSARGPFVPEYVRRTSISWHQILTQHLNDDVKLVGCTLSCQEVAHQERGHFHVPHIQSYVVATDQEGLRVLQDGAVLACHNSWESAVIEGELALSRVVLDAGKNLFSMMARYRDVDWRNRSNWHCNNRMNPIHGQRVYDGVDVHPYEVLFVKVKQSMIDKGWASVKYALKYQEWAEKDEHYNITANERVNKLTEMAAKYGLLCFDASYYRRRAPDLAHLDDAGLLDHFVNFGAKEGRSFRLRCGQRGVGEGDGR